jgi:hypothetical protein
VPDPTLSANGGGLPYSRNRDERTLVCWITTVADANGPPSVLTAGAAVRHGRGTRTPAFQAFEFFPWPWLSSGIEPSAFSI